MLHIKPLRISHFPRKVALTLAGCFSEGRAGSASQNMIVGFLLVYTSVFVRALLVSDRQDSGTILPRVAYTIGW